MRNKILTLFFSLSYNPVVRRIAKKIFIYFPWLKVKLMKMRDAQGGGEGEKIVADKNELLVKIKRQVEFRKKFG